jgi:pyruvate/2-oxoglutarate dehydrogenase complex dihydrolipoamide acyltransferase (E2) component
MYRINQETYIFYSMTAGGIGAWQKKVGDEIQPGDVLVEIETDKAQMDFECQEEGFLAKVLVDTGAKDVAVGQVKYQMKNTGNNGNFLIFQYQFLVAHCYLC